MKPGFSTLHSGPLTEEFLTWTADRLAHMEYFRFEVCHGSLDPYIRYAALPRLNAHKEYLPKEAAILRRVFERVKKSGREAAIWSHELDAPENILEVYPELRTPRGDINLAHPLMTEFVSSKYDEAFKAIPEIDAITLTLTEVAFPVAHRFDSVWSAEERLHWLIRTIYEACRRNGKKLVVRPFSAIRADDEATRRALLRLPDEIEVMLKCDPADWDPFLPLNLDLKSYPPQRLTVEFDLGCEYFGRGELPVVHTSYVRERLDAVRRMGVPRVIGRVDRHLRSALDREGRLNVDFFYACALDAQTNPSALLAEKAAGYYRTRDPLELVRTLEEGFETVKKIFYVDGQLLFHVTFGDLEMATRNVLFETLRPDQPLDHLREEWAILADRRTPSAGQARKEKDDAVAMAEDVRRRLQSLAPHEPMLHQHGENLVLMARLYRAMAVAIQEYILRVGDLKTEPDAFGRACDDLEVEVSALTKARGAEWMEGVPKRAAKFARELRAAFALERRVYQDLPGLDAAEKAAVEDVVAVGYPGEGHRLSKFTHGSATAMEAGRCWRSVGQYVGYTLTGAPGAKRLRFQAAGSGRVQVSVGDETLATHEWSRGAQWGAVEVAFICPASACDIQFEKVSSDTPQVSVAYLLRE